MLRTEHELPKCLLTIKGKASRPLPAETLKKRLRESRGIVNQMHSILLPTSTGQQESKDQATWARRQGKFFSLNNWVVWRGFSGIKQEGKVHSFFKWNGQEIDGLKARRVLTRPAVTDHLWPRQVFLSVCEWQMTISIIFTAKRKNKMPINAFRWKAKHNHRFSLQDCLYKLINGHYPQSSHIPNPITMTKNHPYDENYIEDKHHSEPTSSWW